MTNKQFYLCFGESMEYTDRDAYISDLALSSMWGDADDADIQADRIDELGKIWDAAHRSVCDIASLSGLSQRKLAERFCIPYRTVEDWCRGVRTPPDYVRLMMQQLLNLL